jgi:hypothetical protein
MTDGFLVGGLETIFTTYWLREAHFWYMLPLVR